MTFTSSKVESCCTKLFLLSVDVLAPRQSPPHLMLLRIEMVLMMMMVVLLMIVKVVIEKKKKTYQICWLVLLTLASLPSLQSCQRGAMPILGNSKSAI